MKKEYISWQDLSSYMGSICQQLYASNWRPDCVIGVSRGGLVPATMMSHWLDVPMYSLNVSLRDFKQITDSLEMAEEAFDGKNILIVDEINDSGETINWIMNNWEGLCHPGNSKWETIWGNSIRFATIVDNLASDCQVKMTYVGFEVNKAEDDVWLVFPWENWWDAKY